MIGRAPRLVARIGAAVAVALLLHAGGLASAVTGRAVGARTRETNARAAAPSMAVSAPNAAGSSSGAMTRTATLLAGAASVPIDVPSGTPLAGYGALERRLLLPDLFGRHPHAFWFKPHRGVQEPLRARALVLDAGGARVVWIAVDLIGVDRRFTDEVRSRLGADRTATVIVSASHTHSGPGAFMEAGVMAFVALDRLAAEVREAVLGAVVDAARRADRAKAPARLGAMTVPGPDVTAPRLTAPIDQDLLVLKVAGRDGAPIALLWNYAIHGTMLGPRNHELSGDVMGFASSALERKLGVPALFVNGAVGDVSPRGHGLAAARDTAAALAAAVERVWHQVDPRDVAAHAVRTATVMLPPPALSLRNCLGRFVPRGLELPLDGSFPGDATLVAGAMGDLVWLVFPGELQSSLGVAIKQAARARHAHALLAGLSNDYLGYFVTEADWDRPAYVTCATLYGPATGRCLTAAAIGLIGALRPDEARTSGASGDPPISPASCAGGRG